MCTNGLCCTSRENRYGAITLVPFILNPSLAFHCPPLSHPTSAHPDPRLPPSPPTLTPTSCELLEWWWAQGAIWTHLLTVNTLLKLCFLLCTLLGAVNPPLSIPPPHTLQWWILLNLPPPPALHLTNCPCCCAVASSLLPTLPTSPHIWSSPPHPASTPPHPWGHCCVGRIAHSTRHVCCSFTLCGGVRLGCVML